MSLDTRTNDFMSQNIKVRHFLTFWLLRVWSKLTHCYFVEVCDPLVELILRLADSTSSLSNTLSNKVEPDRWLSCTLCLLCSEKNYRIRQQFLKYQDPAPTRWASELLFLFFLCAFQSLKLWKHTFLSKDLDLFWQHAKEPRSTLALHFLPETWSFPL
jgi:hypothetical protein